LFSALPSPPGSADSEGDMRTENGKVKVENGGGKERGALTVFRVPVKRQNRVGEVPPPGCF